MAHSSSIIVSMEAPRGRHTQARHTQAVSESLSVGCVVAQVDAMGEGGEAWEGGCMGGGRVGAWEGGGVCSIGHLWGLFWSEQRSSKDRGWLRLFFCHRTGNSDLVFRARATAGTMYVPPLFPRTYTTLPVESKGGNSWLQIPATEQVQNTYTNGGRPGSGWGSSQWRALGLFSS